MAFDVLSYSPLAWWDAASPETFINDVNGKISVWLDKSGNDKRFTSLNEIGELRPVLIGNGVYFDRVSAADTGTIVTRTECSPMRAGGGLLNIPRSVFLVVSQIDPSSRSMDAILFGYGGSNDFLGISNTQAYYKRSATVATIPYSINQDNVTVISWPYTATSMAVAIDKSSVGSAVINPLTSTYVFTYLGLEKVVSEIDTGNPYKGFIHEVIICGSLSATAISEIEQYLVDKWKSAISGTVYEMVNGVATPGAYPVYAYGRESGVLVASTTSAADGSYLITGLNDVEHYVMAIDNSAPIQRSAIVDKVVPS